ncbi:B3 domain-containing transcription factor ABI3 [Raphanus sativus]|uniref:B3 domain-containing transcription factor ABI3-like n=1 Tax=Raphanus sativus TaxID=3726 RepID=A0A6J0LRL8_RAPSA|nr:B3 domain-containing transcription factor ABI3-like [Raphanus sativus]KAJ4897701.1 B3 domain-containing transcription factor ABI3 [Raphanus sativus]
MKSLHVEANGGDLAEDCGILAGGSDEAVLMDGMGEVGREIWLDNHEGDHGHGHREDDDIIVHHDPSMFYGDLPTLPDFPCMSSSSSSSTSPAPVNAIVSSASSSSAASSSTSSAASWAILKSDGEDPTTQNQNQYASGNCDVESSAALQSTASMEIPLDSTQGFGCGEGGGDCIDMMETFGYMDLLDSNEFFDTSAIFNQDEDTQNPNLMEQALERKDQVVIPVMENNNSTEGDMQMMNPPLEQEDDLAGVFLEWLKNNKETVSADDLRKVKIKKATIESAAKRLGGGKEAMKQLLKLILEWVQTNHLQRRRTNDLSYQQDPFQNPNLLPPSDQTCFSPSTWVPPPPQPPPPPPPQQQAFVSDPGFGYMPAPNYPSQEYFPSLESPPTWPPPPQSGPIPLQQFTMPNPQYTPFQDPGGGFTGYNMNPYQYPYLPSSGQMRDQGLLRLCSSATKEARKKRMARQRRFLSHHHRHNNNQQNQTQIGEGCGAVDPQLNHVPTTATGGTWMYWPNVPTMPPPVSSQLPAMETQLPAMDRAGSSSVMPRQQVVPDRRQGWKPEKNLRFLLQKVLKQSDVGNLGRIVLPKKEAETHLPELEARDGISLAMEDIGTSRVWNLRYRFWPNNKSRMYLLENTGDFVKTNGLQEGDFIVIYSDVKCGKYLIRGVKVRQPAGQKLEAPSSSAAVTKRQSKSQRSINNNSPSANIVASPTSQAVK